MTTEPATYRKKPVEIQAMRWNGTNAAELEQWTGGHFRTDPRLGHPEAEIWDELHASWINVLRDQWVIRGVKGEFYPCAEDVFEQTYDEVPADAPSRPVAAVPVPVQGADPTGPQTAHSGDDSTPCGAVIRIGDDMVDCSYDEGHSGDHLDATGKVAWSELGLRLPDPWADTVLPESAFGAVTECEYVPRAALTAERERADKAEAERDQLILDMGVLKHAKWQAEQAVALIRKFVAARDEYIVAIKNCHPDNSADYWRWQGHAESRRQLGKQFDKLRAGTEEAQS